MKTFEEIKELAAKFVEDTEYLYKGYWAYYYGYKHAMEEYNNKAFDKLPDSIEKVELLSIQDIKGRWPDVKIICPKCKYLMPCECNVQPWDDIIKEFHLATQQVPIRAPPLIFECWLVENYQPPKKK